MMQKLKLQYFGHLMGTTDLLEKSLMLGKIEGRRRGHHQCNGHELGQTPGDGEGQGGLACASPWGCKESDTTGQLNNNNSRHDWGRISFQAHLHGCWQNSVLCWMLARGCPQFLAILAFPA